MSTLAVNGGTPVWTQGWPSWPEFGDAEAKVLQRVLESGHWAYDGPYEAEFQRRFAELQTARFASAVTSGTTALQLALEALDLEPGDEVILPVNTWQATAVACLDVNLVPILVDIDPDTYTIDVDRAEEAITPRSRAIIPVHLFSSTADMDGVLALAQRHNLHVIEDCAHSHGTRWGDQGVGSLGAFGCFSLQSSKPLNAGEGGMITTNDEQLFDRLYALRNCGRRRPDADPDAWQPMQGGNFRITEWQAAVLCAQLDRLPDQIARRERSREILDRELAQIDGLAPLVRRPQVTRQNLYEYIIRYDAAAFDGAPVAAFRQALAAELNTDEVGGVYHPLNNSPLYQPHTKRRYHLSDEYWRAIDPARFVTPVATRAYEEEAVTFTHQTLLAGEDAIQAVVEACAKIAAARGELAAWSNQAVSQVA